MGIFKNDVGRPSNETKKKRLILKIILFVLILVAFLGFVFLISEYINEVNEKEKQTQKVKETTTKPSTTKATTTTTTKKKETIINIYGRLYEATEYTESFMEVSDEKKDENYCLLGTYKCKNENCNLRSSSSYDFQNVVIKDGDYLVYNFQSKQVNKIELDDYKGNLNYLDDYNFSPYLAGDKSYYYVTHDGGLNELGLLLIGPDYKPILVAATDEQLNKDDYWLSDNFISYANFLYNGNVMYIKGNKYYTYDVNTKKTTASKEYKSVQLIVKDYIVVVDTDNYLKILNYNGEVKAKLAKITDKMYIHDMLSGWYEENKKTGIYVVVEDENVKFDELSEELKKEIAGDASSYSYGYEYYYIPSTGEVGKIPTYIGAYAKPVLYLYPKKDNTKVTVSFAKPELLTTTYPKFKGKWEVTADKNGDLHDKDGKYYYGLYWEENGSINVDFKTGFYVTKENAIDFLEEKLSIIGLNDKERNEFIMYWLPILEKNEKSLVYFELTSSREAYNKLIINPKPDSLLRMAIHIKKVDSKVNIKEQKLTKFKRKGFTVVEWGGVIH